MTLIPIEGLDVQSQKTNLPSRVALILIYSRSSLYLAYVGLFVRPKSQHPSTPRQISQFPQLVLSISTYVPSAALAGARPPNLSLSLSVCVCVCVGTSVTLALAEGISENLDLYRVTGDDCDKWDDVAYHFNVARYTSVSMFSLFAAPW